MEDGMAEAIAIAWLFLRPNTVVYGNYFYSISECFSLIRFCTTWKRLKCFELIASAFKMERQDGDYWLKCMCMIIMECLFMFWCFGSTTDGCSFFSSFCSLPAGFDEISRESVLWEHCRDDENYFSHLLFHLINMYGKVIQSELKMNIKKREIGDAFIYWPRSDFLFIMHNIEVVLQMIHNIWCWHFLNALSLAIHDFEEWLSFVDCDMAELLSPIYVILADILHHQSNQFVQVIPRFPVPITPCLRVIEHLWPWISWK